MTINGAIMELVMLCEHPMMPNYFKPSIQKVIETISEAELVEPKDEPQTETQTETQNSNLTFEKRTIDYCDVCNHKGCDNCIADGNNPYCVPSHYEPKDEPQTERSE